METTACTIAVVFYYILKHPEVRERLEEELRPVIPSASSPMPTLSALEKLPYLTAVINEGHRMANGVVARLARVAPDEDLVCQGIKIPKGVTMSESHYFLHRNPEAFPDPLEFHPERFLQGGFDGVSAAEAQRNLVP
jgi:cytochrome P450